MKLYNFFRNSAGYRVRIALNLKGLAYDYVSVPLLTGANLTPEFLALNPQGLIPALEVDGLVITQSLAIIDYLDRRWPEPAVIPHDPATRAKALAFAQAIACEIHPLNNLRVLRHLETGLGLDDAGRNSWYHHWIATGFSALEASLPASATSFCFGDAPSIADVFLVPQVYNARRFKCDLAPYPKLIAIADHCAGLDAFARAEPSRQPDAP